MNDQHIILSPHLDDAVLSLGGFLAQHGAHTTVATIFAGTPSRAVTTTWDSKSGFTDSNQAMMVRTEENRKALLSLNVSPSRIKNYPFIDCQYRPGHPAHAIKEIELIHGVARACAELIDATPGSGVCVYGPALAMQPDHDILKQALIMIYESFDFSNVLFYLFQDLPYACHLVDSELNFTSLKSYARGDRNVDVHIIPLSYTDMTRKMKAVAFYKSQLCALDDPGPALVDFSAAQAHSLGLDSEYCEVMYRLL